MIYHKMIYQWFTIEKTVAMCISMSSLLPLSGAADRTGCFCPPLEPLLWLADCTLSGTLPGLSLVSFRRIHTAVQLVNTAESAASVIAKFSLTRATYNFVLPIVPSFCLFNRNFPPNNPSAFSIFNSVSPSLLTAGMRRFRVGENTGSKQSCVNCVKIFYRINLGHINRID